ncbi:hypothetical protein [Streptomyces sp. NEAU-YJ-81]|uniref:hypothetical protein n=1 Tax=Streptomyces sp. NEAU-YJ-81 TaxID=2820288 RepID=UPI001ABCB201|nr:hypothetical protein [Streptomyces sp. NEAU-YJ-81]MBO3681389.1 hypothetical protein [Streptomyces sp. NEAU-YJ-81]
MSQSLADAGTAAFPVAEIAFAGDLARPSRLTVADLPAWPQQRAAVSFECATSGIQHHRAGGHRATLSWAEIDPDFGRAPVLLAVTIDDTPLDRLGPQLVLPQDRCGARHISGIDVVRVDGGYTAWT